MKKIKLVVKQVHRHLENGFFLGLDDKPFVDDGFSKGDVVFAIKDDLASRNGYECYDLKHDGFPFVIYVYPCGKVDVPGIYGNLELALVNNKKPKLMKRDTTSKHGIPLDKRRRRRLFRQVAKNTIREGGISYWKKQARNHCR